MFFMGGMTLGYLHPAALAKRVDGTEAAPVDEKSPRSSDLPTGPAHGEGTIERTLLWVRRILC